jgi:hypothetical protein
MSFIYTKAVFEAQLPGMEKLILWVLAERASDEGKCFPGQARIAKDAGLSYSAVQRNLDKLIEKGLIHIVGQQHYKNTLALSTREYELDLVAIKNLVAQSRHEYKPRATTPGSGEPTPISGQLSGGSGEPTGVVAESLLNQSCNQSLDQSENHSGGSATATGAAAAAAPQKPFLSEQEHNFLDHWYGMRGPLELPEAEPSRIKADLPLVKEILSIVPGNGNRLLSFVFTDPGDDNWAGWNKKSPSLPQLLKHVRKGDILVQFQESRKYKAPTPPVPSPSPDCPKCKGRGEYYFAPAPGEPELAADCDCLKMAAS